MCRMASKPQLFWLWPDVWTGWGLQTAYYTDVMAGSPGLAWTGLGWTELNWSEQNGVWWDRLGFSWPALALTFAMTNVVFMKGMPPQNN